MLLRRPSDDESGANDAAFYLIWWDDAFHLADEDVGGLLAHTLAPLLDSCQHGVAGDGPIAVGKAADG